MCELKCPDNKYKKLFNFLYQEAKWMPLTSDMDDIISLVKDILSEQNLMPLLVDGVIEVNMEKENPVIGIAKRDIKAEEIITLTLDPFGKFQSDAIEFNDVGQDEIWNKLLKPKNIMKPVEPPSKFIYEHKEKPETPSS